MGSKPLGGIFAALDGSAYSQAAFAYALDLARLFGARVEGVFVEDSLLLDAYLLGDWAGLSGAAPALQLREGVGRLLRAQGRAVLALAEKEAKKRRVAFKGVLKKGPLSRVVLASSKRAGLVAMGIHGAGGGLGGPVGAHFAAVLRRANKPVLAAPASYKKASAVVAAYDGSRYSRKALALACALAKAGRLPFTVLHVSENESEGRAVLEEAEARVPPSLKAHFVLDHGRARLALHRLAAEDGRFYLVMGAYGHTHFRELVLGSTTHYVLQGTEVPVLLVR